MKKINQTAHPTGCLLTNSIIPSFTSTAPSSLIIIIYASHTSFGRFKLKLGYC